MPLNSRISIFLLSYSLLSFNIAGAQQSTNLFTSSEGRLSVFMEGKPIYKTVDIAPGLHAKCYAHDEKDGAYGVSWSDYPVSSNLPEATVNKALNGACSGAVLGMHGKESSRYSVNLKGGYPGRQIEGTLPNAQGFFRMRLYLVGNRLYQLLVVGSGAYMQTTAPNKFLTSLSIVTAAANSSRKSVSSSKEMQTRSEAWHQHFKEHEDMIRQNIAAARLRQQQSQSMSSGPVDDMLKKQ